MKMCQEHWNHLRNGIQEAGMFHLVAKDGHEAAQRMIGELKGEAKVPDPLMTAHNMILERALNTLGIYIMMPKAVDAEKDGIAGMTEGHYCPLCEAREKLPPHPETNLPCDESWIVTLVEYLKKEYTKEGWLSNN